MSTDENTDQPVDDERDDQQVEHDDDDQDQTDQPVDDDEDEQDDELDGDTFSRSYVQHMRKRSAGYRTRARDAEKRVAQLSHALFTERVAALDVLADPSDMPVNLDLLDDLDALSEAVDELAHRKPHLRKRGASGDHGGRETPESGDGVSLLGIMRGNA